MIKPEGFWLSLDIDCHVVMPAEAVIKAVFGS